MPFASLCPGSCSATVTIRVDLALPDAIDAARMVDIARFSTPGIDDPITADALDAFCITADHSIRTWLAFVAQVPAKIAALLRVTHARAPIVHGARAPHRRQAPCSAEIDGVADLFSITELAVVAVFIRRADVAAVAASRRIVVAFFEPRIDEPITAEGLDAAAMHANPRVLFGDSGAGATIFDAFAIGPKLNERLIDDGRASRGDQDERRGQSTER